MSDDPLNDNAGLNGPIDAQFEPAPASPEAAARRSPGWTALAAASITAALTGAAAGVFGTGFLYQGRAAELSAAQERLETRVGEVIALQSAIDEKLSEPAAASAELAGLIRDLDTVSRRLDLAIAAGGEPSARLPSAAPAGSDVAALTSRLASLEAEREAAARQLDADAQLARQRAEAALALSAIEAATRHGAGFETDYRALRSAVPDSAVVKRLAPYVSGVPALSSLQAEFGQVRMAVLAAEAPEKTSGRLSWIDRAFGDAVSVRPANGKHTAATKALDAAGAALTEGDLKASVAALASLDGAAAAAAEDWTRRASRRITLEDALEDVRFSLAEGRETDR